MCQGSLNLKLNNAIAETSREIVIKYDLLLNMNLIYNLGKIRAMRLWAWPKKVSFKTVESEFQTRVWNIIGFTLPFIQIFFKRWVNNKLKLYESFLLHIFCYIIYYTIIPSLPKNFDIMVTTNP